MRMIISAPALSTYSKVSVNKWLKNALHRILPAACLVCGAGNAQRDHLCQGCRNDLPAREDAALACPGVASTPPGLELGQHIVPMRYAWPVDELVKRLKFGGQLACARPLAQVLLDSNAAMGCEPDLLVPMPLHPKRLRQRGFNQAQEIARLLAAELKVPLASGSLHRARNTRTQTELNRKQRASNVRNAFRAGCSLEGKHVVLIDDVMTTGATARAAALVLRAAGAERVDVWCVALAELREPGAAQK